MSRIRGLWVSMDKSCWAESLKLLLLLFSFVCLQVRIFLLPATLTKAVNGRSRPMRARFPTRTHKCRSSEEAHSLLGQRVCAYRERWTLPQNSELSFEASFEASYFVNSNTWHLICNNFNLKSIWYCMLICVVFWYSRFVKNPSIWSWETNPSFLRWSCHILARVATIHQVIDARPLLSDRCHKGRYTQQHLSLLHTTNRLPWDLGTSYSLPDEWNKRTREPLKVTCASTHYIRHTNSSLVLQHTLVILHIFWVTSLP
jgi:hypothetical protein